MPPGFEHWRGEANLWIPIEAGVPRAQLTQRGYHLFTAVGRLRAGTSATHVAAGVAAADLESDRRIEARSPGDSDGTGVRLVPLRNDVVPARIERLAVVLGVAVVLTWIVVCANLATLLMARGASRTPEMAVRTAIGADRARLIRQVLVESAVLVIPGGALGAVLAWWATGALVAVASPASSTFMPSGLTGRSFSSHSSSVPQPHWPSVPCQHCDSRHRRSRLRCSNGAAGGLPG